MAILKLLKNYCKEEPILKLKIKTDTHPYYWVLDIFNVFLFYSLYKPRSRNDEIMIV